jgi:hypothetical protein
MPDAIEARVSALERRVSAVEELVDDPYEPRSHRNRLHTIEDTLKGERLIATALNELRKQRSARWRANVTTLLALIAIAANVFHLHLHWP